MLANRRNCSKRFFGKNVIKLYFVVEIRLIFVRERFISFSAQAAPTMERTAKPFVALNTESLAFKTRVVSESVIFGNTQSENHADAYHHCDFEYDARSDQLLS